MTEKAPFSWLRKISAHLQEYDQVPLFGHTEDFDWSQFSTLAAARFELPKFEFHPIAQEWKAPHNLGEGLGTTPIALPLKVGPLNGSAFWIMPKESISKLTSWMFNKQNKTRPLLSETLTSGFYRYLALQLLDTASALPPFDKTSILLSEPSQMPETDAFCIDVEIRFGNQTCWGRLAIEPQLQSSWAKFFSHQTVETAISSHAQSIELTLGVKVGTAILKQKEWKTIRKGDFLILDQSSYDPRKHQGAAYLMLGISPLFQVKIKHNKLHLIDYAFIYEDPMAEYNNPETPELDHELTQAPEAQETPMSLKDLPIYVTVELSRVRISLEKLLKLKPGNLIELPIHPEQNVKLTVNGQLVAQGELVHLGETLGVRILSLT